MLLQLTHKCNEGCPHCMISATPNGKTIDPETLKVVMQFIDYEKPPILALTGGEIFDMDDPLSIIKHVNIGLKNKYTSIIYETNGAWIDDPEKCKIARMLFNNPRVRYVQVASHPDYYKDYQKIKDAWDAGEFTSVSKKIAFCDSYQGEYSYIKYMGRARNILDPAKDIKGLTSCTNFLNMMMNARRMNINSMRQVIQLLAAINKVCVPMISINGDFHIGESQLCQSAGNIVEFVKSGMSMEDIDTYLCARCKTMNFCDYCMGAFNIKQEQLDALGMSIIHRN